MKGSLTILCCFIAGVLAGLFAELPAWVTESDLTLWVLYALIFFVGIGIGGDATTFSVLKKSNVRIFLIPAAIIVGSLAGAAGASVFLSDVSVKDAMAIGSGLGYYSLSSIYITEMRGETLGTIALLSNILREIFTLLAAPLLVAWFGRTAPIASAGATAMDTTLPIITLNSGKDFAILALFSGVVLTIAVPILVTFILT
ncbi:lysine exporter LysO family protein [Desulfoluna butyratoxydans]|uniref:Lysine exporter lyso n=1 Tax=Desulfoluna butyratoxydans TaxID=231438 RepID=A0A4U8YNQ2_9BACT|nr:lysine exporter LysO family protein [Desulfoluna butyratoxydans]VFQ43282.1 lysine exporter lyso [Desulfoluna butyratoxydans]